MQFALKITFMAIFGAIVNINTELTELPVEALRQYINARQAFLSYQTALKVQKEYRGSMLFREQDGHSYLVRDYALGRNLPPDAKIQKQAGLGRKSPETEAIYAKFAKEKAEADERVIQLKASVDKHKRLNKALFVGRVDEKIVDIIEGLSKSGLSDHFLVIGTNAMYAYEASAGVRIEERHLATNDLDLLWDDRKKLKLAVSNELAEKGMLGFLQKIDKTFKLKEDQLYTAENADGYEVDIIRRITPGVVFDGKRVTDHEDDFWAIKIKNADWLLSAPKYKEVIVSSTGRMAQMTTVDPRAFVLFKLWVSEQASREAIKKTKDVLQAAVITELIKEKLPQLSFEDIKVFPSEVVSKIRKMKP